MSVVFFFFFKFSIKMFVSVKSLFWILNTSLSLWKNEFETRRVNYGMKLISEYYNNYVYYLSTHLRARE